MPIVPAVQDRLLVAFPRSSNVPLFRAVQEGSYLASHLFEGESFLNYAMGRDLHGHLRRVGIAYQIDLYCQRGDLPFITEIQRMPKGPLHWLQIKSTGALAHVCRTEDPEAFPEEADSREDIRVPLQNDLFSWIEGDRDKTIAKIITDIPELYAWLTFRVGEQGRLSHLCWASPAADANEWVGFINIIQEIARSGSDLPSIKPTPDPKQKLRLRNHIVEQLEKDQKKSTE